MRSGLRVACPPSVRGGERRESVASFSSASISKMRLCTSPCPEQGPGGRVSLKCPRVCSVGRPVRPWAALWGAAGGLKAAKVVTMASYQQLGPRAPLAFSFALLHRRVQGAGRGGPEMAGGGCRPCPGSLVKEGGPRSSHTHPPPARMVGRGVEPVQTRRPSAPQTKRGQFPVA